MAKKMRVDSRVAAAEAAFEYKDKEIALARALLERLGRERTEALMALRTARIDAEADMPQCDVMSVRWVTSKQESEYRAVILRQTPGGLLVVRRAGDPDAEQLKFKWNAFSGRYDEAIKRASLTSDYRILRGVPRTFLSPKGGEQ